ncbi:transporter substrate-binding domain-containing protein [Kitasatospora sp. NBC_00458]|uniref:transporter substrate-binding domain-containing protein n=1 Tax=Kitasatospora sp. NBC_00458 TaxID=2903568 RepID=UPI002E199F29
MAGSKRRTSAVRAAAGAFVLALAAGGCGADEPPSLFGAGKKVRVGAKNDQPGTGLEVHAREFVGLDITVARELLDRVGSEPPKFEGVLSKDRAPVLRDHDVDLVAATFSITVQRMQPVKEGGEGLDFVGPYASGLQGMLVRAADHDRYRTLADFNGRLVCVWRSTTSGIELDKPAYRDIRQSSRDDASSCVKALKAGDVDAVTTDQLILYGFMEAEPSLEVVAGVAFGAPNDYGIAFAKGHRKDCEKLRDALKAYAVNNEWVRDFEINLPKVPLALRNEARPEPSEIDALSCRDRPADAPVK